MTGASRGIQTPHKKSMCPNIVVAFLLQANVCIGGGADADAGGTHPLLSCTVRLKHWERLARAQPEKLQ